MSDAPTAKDVAAYMKSLLEESKFLYQEVVVYQIKKQFGSDFVYDNENGNLAIDRRVLKEFRSITPDVVWEREERCWRRRQKHDKPGSRGQE
jgi:argonaute-like protein implicated in RNA metabolism and viral defense